MTDAAVRGGADHQPLIALPGSIRVLALIDHLALGGAEMLLGRYAAAAPQAGIDLSVACLEERDGNPAALPLREAGVEPVVLDRPGRVGPRTILAVRRHVRRSRPDILHTHLGTSDAIGALVGASLRIPIVCTVHTARWEQSLDEVFKRRLVRRFDSAIIAVSDSAAQAYAERGWAKPGQLVKIYNGVDAAATPGSGAELRSELGWNATHVVIGMLSALREEKAHDVALQAFAELVARRPELRMLIVGDGPAAAQIRALARPLGEHVVVLGARRDVMSCLDAMDICVHPSRTDALPTTIIEAMAAGVPVVATAVGGIPELISAGVSGVLIEPPPRADRLAEALDRLISDPAERTRLAGHARLAYEQRFTAGPWVRSTRTLYEQILEKAAVASG